MSETVTSKNNKRGILRVLSRMDRLSAVTCFISAFAGVAVPYFSIWGGKVIIDYLTENKISDAFSWVIIITIGVAVLGIFSKVISNYFEYIKFTILRKFKSQLSEKALRINFETLESAKPKEIISTLEQYDTTGAMGPVPFLDMMYDFCSSLFSIVIAIFLTATFFVRPAVTVMPIWLENSIIPVLIILYAIASIFIAVFVQKTLNLEEIMPAVGRANAIMSFFSDGVFDLDKAKEARMRYQDIYCEELAGEKSQSSLCEFMKKVDGANAKMVIFTNMAQLILSISVYLLIALKTWYGVISYGDAMMYTTAFFMLSKALGSLLGNLPMLMSNKDYFERVDNYLSFEESERVTTTENTLGCENVEFSFPDSDRKILDGVSISIPKGKKVALVGENGSGKTTMVKLLSGIYIADSGKVDAPSSMTAVFQDFELLNGRLMDVISCSDDSDEEKIKRLETLAEKLNLTKVIDRLPKKFESLYGRSLYPESGEEFSGGESQKLAIMRALYADKDFLIMDEPTAALDPLAEAEIYKMLGDIVEDKGLLLISHRLSSCIFCDLIYVLHEGKIVESGTHDELIAKNGYYKELWKAQADLYKTSK